MNKCLLHTCSETSRQSKSSLLYTYSIQDNLRKRTTFLQRTKGWVLSMFIIRRFHCSESKCKYTQTMSYSLITVYFEKCWFAWKYHRIVQPSYPFCCVHFTNSHNRPIWTTNNYVYVEGIINYVEFIRLFHTIQACHAIHKLNLQSNSAKNNIR